MTAIVVNGARVEQDSQGNFSEEASTLDLGPGEWPGQIHATVLRTGFGPSVATFKLSGLDKDREGEITAGIYVSQSGRRLTVWND